MGKNREGLAAATIATGGIVINDQLSRDIFSGYGDWCNKLVREVAAGGGEVGREDVERMRQLKADYGDVFKYQLIRSKIADGEDMDNKQRVWMKKNQERVEQLVIDPELNVKMVDVYTPTEAMVLRDLCGAISGVYEFIEEGGEKNWNAKNLDLAVEANRRFGEFFIGLDEKLGAGEELYGIFWSIFSEKDFREILEQGGLERFPVGVLAIVKSYLTLKTIYPEMKVEAAPVNLDRDWAVDLVGYQDDELVAVFSVKGIGNRKGETIIYDLENEEHQQRLKEYNSSVTREDLAKSRWDGMDKIMEYGRRKNCRTFWIDVPLAG